MDEHILKLSIELFAICTRCMVEHGNKVVLFEQLLMSATTIICCSLHAFYLDYWLDQQKTILNGTAKLMDATCHPQDCISHCKFLHRCIASHNADQYTT